MPRVAPRRSRSRWRIAAVALQREARRFAGVVNQVAVGECSQELLRARQHQLEVAALDYAAAYGWQAPGEAPP
jgi:hypothetical protein